jgi:hypothetical protein
VKINKAMIITAVVRNDMKRGLSLVEEEQIFEDIRGNVTKETSITNKIPNIRGELLVSVG